MSEKPMSRIGPLELDLYLFGLHLILLVHSSHRDSFE
jgi:hypothetical protein